MIIKPSASIRNDYNGVVSLCRETSEPIYLTRNGEGDAVMMDIATFNKREQMLQLREKLLEVEENRLRGKKGYFIEEADEILRNALDDAAK